MACRFAGRPVPECPTVSNKRAANGHDADEKAKSVNGNTLAIKKLRFDLSSTQTASSKLEPQPSKKRPAADDLRPAPPTSYFKRARVEDTEDQGEKPVASRVRPITPNKRTAFVNPAVLREDEDGRTKRVKLTRVSPGVTIEDEDGLTRTVKKSDLASVLGLDGMVTVAAVTSVDPSDTPEPDGALSSPNIVCGSDHEETKDRVAATRKGTCTSCLDMFPKGDMLQLPCRDDGDTEAHGYCRDCLTRLFESSMTDTSHFPPRCCTKIVPLFSCVPFLSHGVLSRFVAKREELETPNRTYCSNGSCGIWIRPVHITGGVATCGDCKTKTCATCKSRQHDGLCPEDKDVKKLLDVAQKQHWKACPDCNEMVELERGCYHITYVHLTRIRRSDQLTREKLPLPV
jgi:hypothetical protein